MIPGDGTTMYEELNKEIIKISLSYERNDLSEKFAERFELDLLPMAGIMLDESDFIRKMEKQERCLKDISKNIKGIVSAISKENRNEQVNAKLAVYFDILKQEMSDTLIDDKEQRYQFTWPDKNKSILLANTPIFKTLRPVKDDEDTPTGEDNKGNPYCSTGSVDFDNTQNLYIEGDNLEVLKLLQETNLGKMIVTLHKVAMSIWTIADSMTNTAID